MTKITYREILALLELHDEQRTDVGAKATLDAAPLREALNAFFAEREQIQSVLGIDIYRYSGFPNEAQRLIPSLFRFLYKVACKSCPKYDPFLFQQESFEDRFVSTGDGGFQLFSTPLHCLVFATYFQIILSAYNSNLVWPRLHSMVGPLSLRCAITTDNIFRQDDNYYGAAIINNARLMSRDSLNRCLLDGASVKWFNVHMVTLESLIEMAPSELRHLPVFAQYQDKSLENSYFFGSAELSEPRAIKSLHLQKIGFIAVKQTILEIYNLQLQISIEHTAKEGARSRPMVVTLGNLNVTGISD